MLQRRFRAVPGVIDVTGWGGKTKTYELQIDVNKLIAYGITLPQMLQTLNNSNINVGGSTINIGPQVAVVRGVGLIRSLDEIRNTMLAQVGGVPVIVSDVATVVVSNQPRLGIAGRGATRRCEWWPGPGGRRRRSWSTGRPAATARPGRCRRPST